MSLDEGATLTVTLTATDADGDALDFTLTSGPSFATLSGAAVTLAPGFSDSGAHTVNVRVSDGKAHADASFTVTVANVNRPPALDEIADLTMNAGSTQSVALSATDPDGDALSFTASGLPSYATLADSTITFAPAVGVVDSTVVSVTASDGTLTDTKTFTVTVGAPQNQPPALSALAQVSSGGTAVPAGATVSQVPLLRGAVDDPEDGQVKLEAEVVLTSASFTGTPTDVGTLSAEGTLQLALASLPAGTYKWQLRAVDASGAASAWTPFSSGGAAFTIQQGAIAGSLSINAGAQATNNATVTLSIAATPSSGASMVEMRFSNDGSTFTGYESFGTTKNGWTLASGDGSKSVHVEVKDSSGATATFVDTIVLDTSLPSIASFAVNNGAAGTNNASVTLAYSATDTGTGVSLTQASNDGTTFSSVTASPAAWALTSGDGTKTVVLKVTDGAGNSATLSDTIVLDAAAPTISSATLNGGALFTNSTAASLTVVASDGTGSGLGEICVSGSVTAQCFPWGTGTVSIALSTGDGAKNVLVTVRDNAQNASLPASASITLDTVAPTLTSVEVNAGAAFTNSATVSIASVATDNSGGSGLAGIAFRTNGGAFGAFSASYSSPTSYGMTGGDGLKTVGAKVRDAAGNESSIVSDAITLDTVLPSGSVVINSGNPAYTNSAAVNLVFTTSDVSGVTHYCAKSASVAPTSAADACWTAIATTAFTLPTGDGLKTVYVWWKDAAGNFTQTAATDTITLDVTPPTLSVTGSGLGIAGGAAFTNSLTPSFNHSASDATSGLGQVCTGTSSPPGSCVSYSATPTLTLVAGDGVKTGYLRVYDAAGNSSAVLSDTIELDQTPPTLNPALTINGGAQFTNSTAVTVAALGSDLNGLHTIQLSNNGTTFGGPISYALTVSHTLTSGDGTKTVTARVFDPAGNQNNPPNAAGTIILDQTPPSATVVANGGSNYAKISPISVAISPVEGGSGTAKMCIKVAAVGAAAPSAPVGPGDACFGNFATPANVAISGGGEGDKRIYVWLLDNAGNISTSPATDDVWYDATLPTTPTGLSVTAGHRTLTLSWTNATDASSGIAGYEVGVSATSGSGYVFGAPVTPGAGATTSTSVTLSNGVQWFVVVRAVDRAGNSSANSGQVTGTPRFPFVYQQRLPSSDNLRAILATSTRYFIGGNAGAFFTSDDGLATYTRRDPMTDGDVLGIARRPGGTIVLAGERGFLSYSTDDGVVFKQLVNTQPVQRTLRAVTYAGSITNLFTIYFWVAVGDNGTILRGSEGLVGMGEFSPVTSNTTVGLEAVARCASGSGACAAGNVIVAVGQAGTILRSADNGATWSSIPPPAAMSTHVFRAVVGVPNSNTMYITGTTSLGAASGLLRSTDGGATWAEVTSPSFSDFAGHALVAPNSTELYLGGTVSGSETILRLSGATRTTQPLPVGVLYVTGLSARSALEIAGVGSPGRVFKTTNGGSSWTDQNQGAGGFSFQGMHMPATYSQTVWAVGDQGRIYNTTNGGAAWTQQGAGVTNTVIRDVYTIDTNGTVAGTFGFAVGYSGTIVKTTNGGSTWALDADSGIVTQHLHGVACSTTGACTAVGTNQTVLLWNGSGWTVSSTATGPTYYGVAQYLTGLTLRRIIVGAGGNVRISAGTTWTSLTPIGSSDLTGVAAKRDGSGLAIAVGSAGAIYKSTDHGASWTSKASGVTETLRAVEHLSGTTTWYAVGEWGVALKSEDDGESWVRLTTNSTAHMLGVATGSAANRVWIAQGGGGVLYSSVAGQ